jgi:hypothetical protein
MQLHLQTPKCHNARHAGAPATVLQGFEGGSCEPCANVFYFLRTLSFALRVPTHTTHGVSKYRSPSLGRPGAPILSRTIYLGKFLVPIPPRTIYLGNFLVPIPSRTIYLGKLLVPIPPRTIYLGKILVPIPPCTIYLGRVGAHILLAALSTLLERARRVDALLQSTAC